MDIQSVVEQLRQEASRIEHAIAVLTGLGSQTARRGRPKKKQGVKASGQKRRTMSASARAKIAAAQRARWAKQKGKPAPKKAKAAPKKHAGRKPMSAAMRRKLSAMMKARWAQRKVGQGKLCVSALTWSPDLASEGKNMASPTLQPIRPIPGEVAKPLAPGIAICLSGGEYRADLEAL